MFWTIRCVTSVRDLGVVVSLFYFFALTLFVCSIIASSVGFRFIFGSGASFINRWLRRAWIGLGLFRFVGVRLIKFNKIFF